MSASSREKFAVAIASANGARVLRLAGEFDLAAVEIFDHQLSADRDALAKITVFDLSELRFMDSSGLRALIRAETDLRADGGRVVVITSSGQVEDLLELTGVAARLEMADEIPFELRPGSAG